MTKALRRILRGLRHSEKYGGHPGLFPLIFLTLLGVIAGGWRGALIMFTLFGVVFLVGAYKRGEE